MNNEFALATERQAPRKRFWPYLLAAICYLLLATVGHAANAQTEASISVQPEIFTKSLSRSETWEDTLTIVNGSDNAMPIELTVVRWDAANEEGGVTFIEEQEDESFDASTWFELSLSDLIVPPRDSRQIPFTVRVPDDAEPGGKYVSIWVDTRIPDVFVGTDPIKVIPRITPLFLLDVSTISLDEVPEQPGVLAEFALEGRAPVLSAAASRFASLFRAPATAFASEPAVQVDVLDATPESMSLRVRNQGITHIKPNGTLVVRNTFGREAARTDIDSTTILPGKIRELPISLDLPDVPLLPRVLERQLALGRYRAQIVLENTGGEPIVASLSYWVFPWQSIALYMLLFGGGGFALFRFRERFAMAARVLLRGSKKHEKTT